MERRSAGKCGFCGERRDVLAGKGALLICSDCVRLSAEVVASAPPKWERGECSCSFCGATNRDVATMIAGPTQYICDACVVDAEKTVS